MRKQIHASSILIVFLVLPVMAEMTRADWIQPTTPPSRSVVIAHGQRPWPGASGGVLDIPHDVILSFPPSPVIGVRGEIQVLSEEKPNLWGGGTILKESPGPLEGTRMPGRIDTTSVVVRSLPDPQGHSITYTAGQDYYIEPGWGGLCRLPDGRIPKGQTVLVDYEAGLMRIDAIARTPEGALVTVPGTPAAALPQEPSLPDGYLRLANVFLNYGNGVIESQDICPITREGTWRELITIEGYNNLEASRRKLASGKSFTAVCLGDSVTAGGTAPGGKDFVNQFGQDLKKRYPQSAITVVNAGAGGTNSDYGLERFDRDVLAHHPDLVVIEFVNDMNFPPEKLAANYGEVARRLREAGKADVILLTPHYVMRPWMANYDRYVESCRSLARELGFGLGDTGRIWEGLRSLGIPYETLLANGINHPDERGHEFFTETLLQFFK